MWSMECHVTTCVLNQMDVVRWKDVFCISVYSMETVHDYWLAFCYMKTCLRIHTCIIIVSAISAQCEKGIPSTGTNHVSVVINQSMVSSFVKG